LEIRSSQFPENAQIADTLNGLGIFSTLLGDFSAAERYHRKALQIRERSAPGSIALAETLLNLGSLAKERKNYTEAKVLFHKALAINQAQSSPLSVATSWKASEMSNKRLATTLPRPTSSSAHSRHIRELHQIPQTRSAPYTN